MYTRNNRMIGCNKLQKENQCNKKNVFDKAKRAFAICEKYMSDITEILER